MIYARHPRSIPEEIEDMLDAAKEEVRQSAVDTIRADGRVSRRNASHDALLRAGLDLFLRNVSRPSDKEICKEARRSVRTFYEVFSSTEEYWMEVFRTYEQSIKGKIAETLEAGDGYTLMRLILLGRK